MVSEKDGGNLILDEPVNDESTLTNDESTHSDESDETEDHEMPKRPEDMPEDEYRDLVKNISISAALRHTGNNKLAQSIKSAIESGSMSVEEVINKSLSKVPGLKSEVYSEINRVLNYRAEKIRNPSWLKRLGNKLLGRE